MTSDGKKPGVAFWTTVVVVVVLVAYPLSFGPASAIFGPRQLLAGLRPDPLFDAYQAFYRPVHWAMKNPLNYGAMDRYCALWEHDLL